MRAYWWSCVLGLLCVPAEVTLGAWTVSQQPLSITRVTVNSSTEITCSTSLSEPAGVYLYSGVHDNKDVVYLHFDKGQVKKTTINGGFAGRIHICRAQQIREGFEVAWQLSLLGLEDTDFYYCSWIHIKSETSKLETFSSNGTIVIVRERNPQEHCQSYDQDLVFIVLSVTAGAIVLILYIGAVIVRCRRVKKRFRCARDVTPPRTNRPQHICPQQRVQACPYLITSVNTLDFRGIL